MVQPRTRSLVVTTLCVALGLLGGPAWSQLDSSGNLDFFCSLRSGSWKSGVNTAEYAINGECTYLRKIVDSFGGDSGFFEEVYYFLSDAKYSYDPIYKKHEVTETARVWGSSRTPPYDLLGDINNSLTCTGNPFTNHLDQVSCTGQHSNSTGVGILSTRLPLAIEMAANGGLGKSRERLVERVPEDLSDWDPYAGRVKPKVEIVSPSGAIPTGGTMDLILAPVASAQPDWVIQLEWARIEPPKDASLSTESFVPFVPSHSLKGLAWSQNPSKIQVANLFSPGLYAVRAQVAGDEEDDWTAWHRFAIGTVSLETATRNRPGMSDNSKVKKLKPIPPPQ
ncbi:MAG: hypothetical protein WBI00_06145 [Thermoanaerobaculia bacterium]